MSQSQHSPESAGNRRYRRVGVVCAVFMLVALAVAWLLLRDRDPKPAASSDGAIDVPLGVEEAVIIRYAGPQLVPRPYRRGASVTLRIARQEEEDRVRVYDVRYVVNLPGEFDLTDYLASSDGASIDDLPGFRVRGVTRLTKDIDTRIHEIEEVQIGIWHWYYESLAGIGILWIAWLLGLVIVGRSRRRVAPEPVAVRPPSVEEQIARYLRRLKVDQLNVEEKAELEVLLLNYWRNRLGDNSRLADLCQRLEADQELCGAYSALQRWLHAPNSGVDPSQVATLCRPRSRGSAEVTP